MFVEEPVNVPTRLCVPSSSLHTNKCLFVPVSYISLVFTLPLLVSVSAYTLLPQATELVVPPVTVPT